MGELSTMTTDYLLGGATILLSILLFRRSRHSPAVTMAWMLVMVAVAAILGGTFHGIAFRLRPVGAMLLWKATTFSIGIAGFLLIVASAFSALSRNVARIVTAIAAIQLLLYFLWMSTHDDFGSVMLNYAVSLAIAIVAGVILLRRGNRGGGWLLAAVGVSIAAGVGEALGFSPLPGLNHNDTYHLIQIAASYSFFRAGQSLIDSGKELQASIE